MNSTTLPGVPSNIGVLMGPVLLGQLASWFLFGVLALQTCESRSPRQRETLIRSLLEDIYYLSFPNDKVHVKILVYGLFLMEILQAVMVRLSTVDAL